MNYRFGHGLELAYEGTRNGDRAWSCGGSITDFGGIDFICIQLKTYFKMTEINDFEINFLLSQLNICKRCYGECSITENYV